MKEIERLNRYYQCEDCGNEYSYEDIAKECEQKHVCRHEELRYSFDGYNNIMTESCAVCRRDLDNVSAAAIPIAIMNKIFGMMKDSNSKG